MEIGHFSGKNNPVKGKQTNEAFHYFAAEMKSKENTFFLLPKLWKVCRLLPLVFLFTLARVHAQGVSVWDSIWSAEPEKIKTENSRLAFRPSSYCIEDELNKVLDSLAELKRNAPLIPGFRILLYSGNDREQATKARENAYRVLPRADVYTLYQAPTFKVKLGDYFQKIEAYRELRKLRYAFPYAVIIQEIVNIKN
jgi:hypothetical protein